MTDIKNKEMFLSGRDRQIENKALNKLRSITRGKNALGGMLWSRKIIQPADRVSHESLLSASFS